MFSSFSILHAQGGHFSGIYRKVQLKPLKWVKVAKSNGEGEEERPVEALMVLKYGGVLTHAGRKQVMIIYGSYACFCFLLVIAYMRNANSIVDEKYTCGKLFFSFLVKSILSNEIGKAYVHRKYTKEIA